MDSAQIPDRELLELAGKAEGTVYQDDKIESIMDGGPVFLRPDGGLNFQWNPLVDDADAFRLAVKLQIIVGKYDEYASAGRIGYDDADVRVWNHEATDPYSATRRAIVRAAAAIGAKP